MKFEFATATRIIFGEGKLKGIGGLASELGKRALVLAGKDSSRAKPLLELLAKENIITTAFTVPSEPTVQLVEQGTSLARTAGCGFAIAFGGGSAIDAGKAIAAMLTNEGELLDYLEVIGKGRALTKRSAPFIAIPTTAGAGAEVTRNAVLASPEHKFKVSLRSPLILPKIALIDPEQTYGLPPAITASTGLDALTQLIEPYTCCRTNRMVDALCVEGIRCAARSLRVAFTNGSNTSAREDMCVASLFGGFALANAGLGAVHGFAAPIGGMFSAPHGAVCAALLPHVMTANLQAVRSRATTNDTLHRYEEVARLVTGSSSAKSADGVRWVNDLVHDLQIPKLREYGVGEQHVGELVEKAAKASSMKANPIMLTVEELSEILRAAI